MSGKRYEWGRVGLLGGIIGLMLGLVVSGPLRRAKRLPQGGSDSIQPLASGRLQSGRLLERDRPHREWLQALKHHNGTHRWLWLASQAEAASSSEIPRLIRLAEGDWELLKMLGARWSELDPQHMFEYLIEDQETLGSIPRASDLVFQLLRGLDETEFQSMVSMLSNEAAIGDFRSYRWAGVNTIMKRDPELGLRLMNEWGIRSFIPSMESVVEWADGDTLEATRLIGAMMNPDARRSAMKEVAKVWVDRDPEEALNFAKTLGGVPQGELVEEVSKIWAKRDLDAAVAFASAMVDDATLLAHMSAPLVAEWAKIEPEDALLWSQEHLPAPARAQAIGRIVGYVVDEDLQAGIALVDGLRPGGAKNQAVVRILEKWVTQASIDVGAIGEWLSGLDDQAMLRRAMEKAQWSWLQEQPEAARAFVQSDHGYMAPDGMLRGLADQEVRVDPASALTWARSLKGEQAERAQALVIEQWYRAHPDAAVQWATREAKGDLHDHAIMEISRLVALTNEAKQRAWADALGSGELQLAKETMYSMALGEEQLAVVKKVFGEP